MANFQLTRDVHQRHLFPFCKRSLSFLTVDPTIGNQDRCNILTGLIYSKANNTSFNSRRKNDVEAQVEFTLKVMERVKVTCY